mmetsp:Transcript_52164/g.117146  ORF Transcript_52164/g.117146 Transcript_52164/m.117146 type:complete len:205 (+) Transcript_52164:1031-1645(+)
MPLAPHASTCSHAKPLASLIRERTMRACPFPPSECTAPAAPSKRQRRTAAVHSTSRDPMPAVQCRCQRASIPQRPHSRSIQGSTLAASMRKSRPPPKRPPGQPLSRSVHQEPQPHCTRPQAPVPMQQLAQRSSCGATLEYARTFSPCILYACTECHPPMPHTCVTDNASCCLACCVDSDSEGSFARALPPQVEQDASTHTTTGR